MQDKVGMELVKKAPPLQPLRPGIKVTISG